MKNLAIHSNNHVPLDKVDWTSERQPPMHPIPVRVTPSTIYHNETGEVVATAAPGYEFYYAHHHFHVQPSAYVEAVSDATPQQDVITQAAIQTNSGLGGFLSGMVGTRMLPLLAALSKRES